MKKKILVLVLFIVFTVNAFAQTAFDYLKDSLIEVLSVSTLMQLANYEYDEGNALMGTYLESGKTITLISDYDANVEYLIIAAADDLDCDIGLRVYKGGGTGGTVIARDTNPGAAAVVRFTPKTAEENTFELINSGDIPAFISLVVLKYKKDAMFSFETLVEALGNTLDLATNISEMLPPEAVIPPNKWTLFGGSVRERSNTGYFNAQLPSGGYIIAAAGEFSVTDIDVEILQQHNLNNSDGRKVSINSDSVDSIDCAIFEANSSKYYNLKVINKRSKNTSAFMFGFLIQVYED